MATQGPNYPLTAAGEAVAPENAEPWANVNNIKADDGSTAAITASTFDSNDISNRLKGTNFGFTIPAGATIDGITVEIEKSDNNIGSAVDYRIQLLDASGALVGDNKADTTTNWPNTLTIITYGGATDKWNASPTPAMVNDVDFGVVLSVKATSQNTDVFVDFIRVTVHYTDSGPVEADGVSVGTSTVAAVGALFFLGVGAATGVGTPSIVAASVIPGVSSSDGAGSSSVVGATVLPTNGSVAGVASDSVVGSLTFASEGLSLGTSDPLAVSSATAGAELSAAGSASVSGVSGAIASAAMSSEGVAASAVAGAWLYLADGVSAGQSTVVSDSVSVLPGVASSSGSAGDSVVSASVFSGVASGSGVGASDIATAYLLASAGSSSGETLAEWIGENAGGGFPTQYFGLRAYFQGAVKNLCLVAEGDAPTNMGGVLKVKKGSTIYAVYLVETNDQNASPIRLRTSTGTKAIRLKT